MSRTFLPYHQTYRTALLSLSDMLCSLYMHSRSSQVMNGPHFHSKIICACNPGEGGADR